MTPFDLALQNDLSIECQRFANKWLFPWHGMTYEGGSTDVDDFRGGRIRYSGVQFDYQRQQIFRQAVERYLVQKIHSTYQQWDEKTRDYPSVARKASLEMTGQSLLTFVGCINGRSRKTYEVLLRWAYEGNQQVFQTIDCTPRAQAEINRMAEAHGALLMTEHVAQSNAGSGTSGELVTLRPGLWGLNIDLKEAWRRIAQWWRVEPR
jgi:hypothetical protein